MNEEILKRLDAMQASLQNVAVDIASLKARDEEHHRNIERFWEKQWPELQHSIQSNSAAISALVAQGERHGAMIKVGAAVAVVVLGGVVTLVFQVFAQ